MNDGHIVGVTQLRHLEHPLKRLVLGTRNKKKGLELAELLAPHRIDVRTLADFPNAIHVVEDGQSFAENAAKKAIQQAVQLKEWVLGEDSGLCVDALKGAPGIYSARFSGEHATDASNNEKLLQELSDVPEERRSAYYVCHMTLADPVGNVQADSEGWCRGVIRFTGSGTAGFGYDPLFEVLEYHQTFGELGSAVKAALSHRARAMRQFMPQLFKFTPRHVR